MPRANRHALLSHAWPVTRRFATPDWRWLAGGGVVLGASLGVMGFLWLEHPGWLGLWAALFLGLGWAGWDVRLRQVGKLAPARPSRPHPARAVKDGPFVMVELAGGTFTMGSPETDDMGDRRERPQHQVTVGGFRIGRMPVTQGQWRDVTGEDRGSREDENLPVTELTWEQAVAFCNTASRRAGCRLCYRKAGVWPFRHWVCDWSADGYRLPTEAEWEYACRAGTDTRWSFGDEAEALGDSAWYGNNAGGQPHPVAEKRPNPWGLYDMHGNVWEWCWDWDGQYSPEPATNPRGPKRGRNRVLRGGAFDDPPRFLRSASRIDGPPEGRRWSPGFRCVRVPARQD
jgi:sulfatase modifying factor 1